MFTDKRRTRIILLVLILCVIFTAGFYVWTPPALVTHEQSQEFVHCFSVVQHENGSIGYTGHPPLNQEIQLSDSDKLVETKCLSTWAEAADFISGGAIKLPANATQKDYERATEEWATAR